MKFSRLRLDFDQFYKSKSNLQNVKLAVFSDEDKVVGQPLSLNLTNSIGCGGHQVSFKIDDLDDKSNFQKLVECLLQNKNKVSLILIVGGIIYLYFAKLPFLKVNIHNN